MSWHKEGERSLPPVSEDEFHFLAPKKTRELVLGFLKRRNKFDNMGLLFHKYAAYHQDGGGKFYFYRQKNKERPNIFDILRYFQVKEDFYKQVVAGLNRAFKELEDIYIIDQLPPLELAWRLAIGLGSASVYETSLNFHHVYGVPWVPGSAFKGMVRSYIILNCFDREEEKALEDENFREIFGYNRQSGEELAGSRGKVLFFDGYPENYPQLKVDIMNPHFDRYYTGSDFPTDHDKPKMINFLTVEGAKFIFRWGAEKAEQKVLELKIEGKTISYWIKEAFQKHGLGAKTSLGYGLFK